MGILIYTLLLLSFTSCSAITGGDSKTISRRVIDVEGGPEDVIWVVQLSDLHFSVHHPERALDFKRLVGPALSIIRPSLVLLTGDLTGLISLLLLFELRRSTDLIFGCCLMFEINCLYAVMLNVVRYLRKVKNVFKYRSTSSDSNLKREGCFTDLKLQRSRNANVRDCFSVDIVIVLIID